MFDLLRVIHIVFGVLWTGGVFFLAVFLIPSSRAIGPAAGPMMNQLTQVRQLPRMLIIFGLLTIVAGFWMYFINSASADHQWVRSTPAKIYGAGAIFALIGWFMGMMVNAPLAKKIGALGAKMAAAGGPPSDADKAAMGAMQSKMATVSNIGVTLLLLATVCMAVARYIP